MRESTIKRRAQEMLDELSWRSLEVSLGRAPDQRHTGHMIRRVDNQNPKWYQKLCDDHQKRRGTYVRRCEECGLYHDSRRRRTLRRLEARGRACPRGRKRPHVHWKSDTSIKRAWVIKALEEIITNGSAVRTEYGRRLLDVIHREWEAIQQHRKNAALWAAESRKARRAFGVE
jgi:hypothetical protein